EPPPLAFGPVEPDGLVGHRLAPPRPTFQLVVMDRRGLDASDVRLDHRAVTRWRGVCVPRELGHRRPARRALVASARVDHWICPPGTPSGAGCPVPCIAPVCSLACLLRLSCGASLPPCRVSPAGGGPSPSAAAASTSDCCWSAIAVVTVAGSTVTPNCFRISNTIGPCGLTKSTPENDRLSFGGSGLGGSGALTIPLGSM